MAAKRIQDRQQRIRQALAPITAALPVVGLADARQVLQHEADKPMRGAAAELQHDGLFGDAYLQVEMFQ